MLDPVDMHRRGLEVIKVDLSTYSSFVVPLLMDKLPVSIRLNMIQFNEKDQLEWMVPDFMRALEKEIKVRESHVPIWGQVSTTAKQHQ